VRGGGEDLCRSGQERFLAGKQVLGETGDLGPVRARDGIVRAEVEQGLLTHGGTAALGVDEAEAEARLAADGVGLGGADEHQQRKV